MRRPNLTTSALLALWLGSSTGLQAQARAALSAQDQLEIQQLATRYAIALDTRGGDGNALADVFTPDGELVGLRGSAKGRAAIADLARRGVMTADRPVADVSHFSMNHVIQPAAGGASGQEYVMLVNFGSDDKPGGEFSTIGGHYEDAYVKTATGWRFRRREYIAARPAEGSRQALTTSPAAPTSPSAPVPAGATPLSADDYLAIRALVNSSAYGLDKGSDGRLNARHFLSNHLIEATPDGARGRVYVMVLAFGSGTRPTSVSLGGLYEDVYERTPAGWRVKDRRFFSSKSAQTLAAEGAAR